MKPKNNTLQNLGLIALTFAGLSSHSAQASNVGWSGSTSSSWNTAANWTPNAVPTSSDIAVFSLAAYANQPNAGTNSVAGLQIGDGTTVTGALTLSGTSLTLGTSGISMLANSGAATISSPLVLGVAQSWSNTSTGTLAINGAVTRNAGTAVNFVPTGVINLAAGSGLANTNGILGGWATVGNGGGSGATADWAAVDGSGNVVTYAGYTAVSTGAATAITLDGTQTAFNYKAGNSPTAVGAAYTTTWSKSGGGVGTINSLAVVNDNSITSGSTLSVGSGGLILDGISRWILNNGGGNTTGTGQLTSGLASGELFVDVASSAADANNWRIWTKIVDNGVTPVALVKTGPGDLGLLNSNTYTGGTYVDSGTLSIAGASSVAGGDLRLNGGRLNIRYAGANVDLPNNIVISGSSSNIYLGVAKNLGLNGTVSGSGALTFGNDTFNSTVYLNGANTMTSGTITLANNTNSVRFTNASAGNANVAWVINNTAANRDTLDFATGTISFGSMTGAGLIQSNGAGTKTISAGALNLNDTFSGVIANGSGTVSVIKVGTGTWTLSGANSFTGGSTVNGGTLQIGNGTTGSIAGAVTIGASGTLALNLPAATTFANSIANGGAITTVGGNALTLSGALDGAGSILKSDAGTLTLAVSGSFSGNTNVSAGKLQVNSIVSDSSVTLGAATLAGNGTVGAVTVNNAGAVITNGISAAETLNAGSLTFTTGATLNLNKANDTFTPALAIAGNLTTAAGITINVPVGPVWVNGTYTLINYGSLTGPISNLIRGSVAGLGGRQSATLSSTGPTDGSIILTIGGDSPYWTGAKDNTWNTAVGIPTKNWRLITSPFTATDFQPNDQVLFNDNATGSTSINISAANVQVAGVTFDNSSKAYTISSTGGFGIADFSSPASLIKNNDGIVTLNTTNSYTGSTTITAGTLQLGDGTTNGDIASSSSIANDGILILNRSIGSFTYGNATSGFGEIIKNGAGTQIFTGASTRIGITTINAGTLQVGNAGLTGSLGSGSITNNTSLVFNRTNGVAQGTDFGSIDGTGSVTQAGTGTVTLFSGNSYSGGTNINSGTVIVGGTDVLGAGPVTVAGGTLSGSTDVDGNLANALVAQASTTSVFFTNGRNLGLNGNLSGGGNINRTAAGGAATVYLGGNNSGFSGTFTVDANGSAATRFGAATAGSQNAKWVINQSFNSRASLDFGGGTIQFGSLTGTGFFTSQGLGINTIEVGNLGLSEAFPGVLNQGAGSTLAVTKVGTGTWTLTGANTYTGDTTVNAGVLAVNGNAIANTNKLVINGGKVDPMGATEVVDSLYFGATQKASGTWGATGSTATHIDDVHFTGTGVVSVTSGPVGGYTSWADANAPGQTIDQDHDNDGVKNGVEYFMGLSGSGFTANPAPVSGAVTWPMGATYTGVYGTDYEVQYSTDLVNWTQAPIGTGDNTVTVTAGTSVVYDMPTGGKSFVRLVVKN
ncbi:MAG: autotransporter-associated beta strand repeat-containing protein [Luteolibacter sp.]